MYEQPELNEIGDAADLVLGIDSTGYDFDGLLNSLHTEFGDDGED
ncbi:MAG TPA: lasso RiPP family leader peptide-containing protein [Bryobacteraceae bacterium]|nr:lasso RiPP family leader peptide-containing protein [Bryobacteraceae bacterium]